MRKGRKVQCSILVGDTASVDVFRFRDESLEETDKLPDSDVLDQKIVDDLETALEQFREFTEELGVSKPEPNR